jgi:glycosyltransferase involved in cell wall biosynthesis
MINAPTISIITVTFNAEKHLEETILSVANQTFKNIEYLIVDGLSKDNTLNIVKKHDNTVTKYISEKDSGVYDAMNKGVSIASGDYIMLLHAGDLLHDNEVLERVFSQCGKLNSDIIYADTAIINESYQTVGLRHLKPPKHLSYKSFQKGMVVCHQAFIVKKALCDQHDIQYAIAADIDWAIRITKKANSFCFYDAPLVKFMQGGLSTQKRFLGLRERFVIMTKHYGILTTVYNNVLLGFKYLLSLRFIENIRK